MQRPSILYLFPMIFVPMIFGFALLMTGCIQSSMLATATPTPTPVADDTGDAFVFTANQGGNTISAFKNDSMGKLTPISGSPFSSPGEPWGLAATPNNKFLYVSSFQNALVTGFSINSATGSLMPLSCGAAATTGVSPGKISITPAGEFLFTANLPGSISGFSINATTGCLTAVSTTATDSLAREITVERNGRFLYVATSGGINAFSIAADGTLTRLPAAGFDPGTQSLASVKASPTTDVLIATDTGVANAFHTLVIDTNTGVLTHKSLNGIAGNSPAAVSFNPALDPMAPMVYVANLGSDNFISTNVDAIGEVNFFSQLVSDSSGPIDLGVDPAGKFVYVANSRSNNVAAFMANINGSNFNSVFIGSTPAGTMPRSIVVVGHP